MNYLACNHCHFKNSITTERLVFCKECGKKINANYTDWKKAKFDSSFETYITSETTQNGDFVKIQNSLPKEKNKLFQRGSRFIKSHKNRELKIFVTSTLLQLLLGFLLMNQSFSGDSSRTENKPYLKDVQWANYFVSPQISMTLPFELRESKSVLPGYLHNYLSNDKASKSESSKSFSVTIEEFDVVDGMTIDEKSYLNINDEYMQNPGTSITSVSSVDHLKIKHYATASQYGTYTMDNRNYVYENYTLTSGKKAIKIIISYLEDDKLLRRYAEIVTQSLHRNIDRFI
ncbi:MAG: hypothetical protein K0S53_122 [Bacteroidetes bacterium]|jgi:hypothetical protein|nr:hypothetical protein [Bacteroidota bacterium]MDF2452285.1 hypothetical protein [Bacteroidota bacterium]